MSKSTIIFILAITLIPATVFSVAYYFSVSLKSDLSDLTVSLEQIEELIAGNEKISSEKLKESVDAFNKKWKKYSARWCSFFDHEQIHQVEFMRSDLESEVFNLEYSAARITVSKIKCTFDLMSKHDALNVSNFF